MNERQAYEKHLADKLQQLPPPADIDRNWGRMRALLDNDLPRGGGGWRNRWWITGMIAGLLLTGTWLLTQPFSANDRRQSTTAAVATPTHELPPAAGSSADAPTPATEKQQRATAGKQSAGASMVSQPAPTGTETAKTRLPAQKQATVPAAVDVPDADKTPVVAHETTAKQRAATSDRDVVAGVAAVPDETVQETEKNNQASVAGTTTGAGHKSSITAKSNNHFNNTTNGIAVSGAKKQQTPIDEFSTHPSLVKHTADDSGMQVQSPSRVITSNYAPAFTKAEVPPAPPKRNTTPRFVRSKEHKTLVVGLSLPLAFPLGDQKPLSYNRNAGSNAVSDYIPSPHLQYHLNKKTYIQTEVQVYSPQYIRPILLYEQKQQVSPGNYLFNSVYARKLYYLNIPVGIHHSPFRNFYMGTGVQLSSMLSGIALREERTQGPSPGTTYITNQQYTRFRNDSLSNRFNGTEMRLLLDVNYYWQRFTVGLRYNQAFTNYVSFQLNNNTSYTYDKNKALQFYLRYNIWEDLKRKNSSKSLLSLK